MTAFKMEDIMIRILLGKRLFFKKKQAQRSALGVTFLARLLKRARFPFRTIITGRMRCYLRHRPLIIPHFKVVITRHKRCYLRRRPLIIPHFKVVITRRRRYYLRRRPLIIPHFKVVIIRRKRCYLKRNTLILRLISVAKVFASRAPLIFFAKKKFV
jgi:hypothetical protein